MICPVCTTRPVYYTTTTECRACYERRRYRLKAYGRLNPRTVAKPDASASHIRRCRAVGMGLNRMAELSGLSKRCLQEIVNGHVSFVLPATERYILSVPATPDLARPGARLPFFGTQRRLQALIAAGHSVNYLADRMDTTHQWVTKLARRPYGTVWISTYQRVGDLFSELEATPGAHKHSIRVGEQKIWARPLAWVEEEIDDPLAWPRMNATEWRNARKWDRRHTVWKLADQGLTPAQMAPRFHVAVDTIRDDLRQRA